MKRRPALIIAMTLILLTNVFMPITYGASIESLLKGALKLFGTKYVIEQFGPNINDVINTLTMNNDKLKETDKSVETMVVPILSVGSGAYIGAAQVSGPKEKVDKVKAVAQIQGEFFGNAVRATALVPVDNINVLEGVKRVSGVGVSAIIDFKF